MRRTHYSPIEWLTTIGVVLAVWAAFFVSIGFLSRVAKELFCVGFGC